MKQLYILIIFTSISFLLLVVQIGLLKRSFGQLWLGPNDLKHASEKNIKFILTLTARHNVPVFPVDARFLQNVESRPSDFCELGICSSRVASFATFSKYFAFKPLFFEDLRRAGFEVVTTEGYNRHLLKHGYRVTIPCHHIFYRWGHAVHFTIFYERETGYWWHFALDWNETITTQMWNWSLKKEDFKFAVNEGAYNRFDLIRIRLFGYRVDIPRSVPSFLTQMENSHFVECNYSRAKLFHDQYGKDISAEALEFKSDAWRLLAKTKELLNSLSLRFWLSSGTCLGYFRQCDIIPYSKDVDIGIWISDYNDRLISTLSSHGLSLKHVFGKLNDSFELSFQDGDVKLDLFFFYEEHNHMWNGGTQARTGKKFKYTFPKFRLCWTEFLELKVRIPCPTEPYVVANYGPRWWIPQKTWDWKKDPSNVKENGLWPEEEWPQVIQVMQFPGQ